MRSKLKAGLLCALCALAVANVTPAQQGTFNLDQLVSDAQARSDAMKTDLLGLKESTVEKSRRYTAEAATLANGNRERLRKGLTYLGREYDVDLFDDGIIVDGGVIYVAISLSMPSSALRQLSADAQKSGAVLVIRGFLDGSFKKTQLVLMRTFSQEEAAGILIDPWVFQQYHIERVPTFIAAERPVQSCEDGGLECTRADVPFDSVKGNISLATALRLIAEKGDAAPAAARKALDLLEDPL